MSIIETITINATVTIPLTIQYTYEDSYPGDPALPPHPASVSIIAIKLDEDDIGASLAEEYNNNEIENVTLIDHEDNQS